MVLWRISHFHDLSGSGGLKYSARWHVAGRPVVYTADSSAGALLEVCAHTSRQKAPLSFTLLKVVGPDLAWEEVSLSSLPTNWTDEVVLTRSIGSNWLGAAKTALMKVPSSLVPESWNYLLNPMHPEARAFQIERAFEYPFDVRLKA